MFQFHCKKVRFFNLLFLSKKRNFLTVKNQTNIPSIVLFVYDFYSNLEIKKCGTLKSLLLRTGGTILRMILIKNILKIILRFKPKKRARNRVINRRTAKYIEIHAFHQIQLKRYTSHEVPYAHFIRQMRISYGT